MRSPIARFALWLGVSVCFFGLAACGGGSSTPGTPPGSPGALDPSFDGDGVSVADIVAMNGRARAVQIAPDGRIVVLGNPGNPTVDGLRLARFTADGSLDSTFAGDGMISIDAGGPESWRGLAVQADGKIVVGGDTGGNLVVRRFHVDGSNDTTFATGGLRTIDLFATEQGGFVAVQADGKILVGGTQDNGTIMNLFVARLNTDGSPDGSFGGGAVRTIAIAGDQDIGGMTLQPNQRVLIVGSNGAGAQLAARLTIDGDLDTSFGPGGTTNTGPGHASFGSGIARDAVVDGSGALFICGSALDGAFAGSSLCTATKLTANGAADGSFGTSGIVTQTFPEGSSIAWGIVQQASGRLVLGGTAGPRAAFWALTSAGATDASFNGGVFTVALGADGGVFGLALQSDGKVIGAGFADGTGAGPEQLAVVRLQ